MENVRKVLKCMVVAFLLLLFFHPIGVIFFIVTHIGVIAGVMLIYTILRLMLGMSIMNYISRMNENEHTKEE